MRPLALALVCLTSAACGSADRTALLDQPGAASGSVVADLGAGPVELGASQGVVLRRDGGLVLELTAARSDTERVTLTVRWDALMLDAMATGDAMGVNLAMLFDPATPEVPVDRKVMGENHEFRIRDAYAQGTCLQTVSPPRRWDMLTTGEVLVDALDAEHFRGRLKLQVLGALGPGCPLPSQPTTFDVAFEIRAAR